MQALAVAAPTILTSRGTQVFATGNAMSAAEEAGEIGPLADDVLPSGVRSRFVDGINGLRMHVLEAGYEDGTRPGILLLHGFPELAYSWRKVMLPLANAGFHVVAPDQRGYGRTTGWDGDYDGDLSLGAILRFMDRVESRTGVVPVAYLENSRSLKLQTRAADRQTKARLRRAPYWVALYSHTSGKGSEFPAPGDPQGLVRQYGLWPRWTMWQYGGVEWANRRSHPKVYSHGRYRFGTYFGNLDRPVERNVFNGSHAALAEFWKMHGISLR